MLRGGGKGAGIGTVVRNGLSHSAKEQSKLTAKGRQAPGGGRELDQGGKL